MDPMVLYAEIEPPTVSGGIDAMGYRVGMIQPIEPSFVEAITGPPTNQTPQYTTVQQTPSYQAAVTTSYAAPMTSYAVNQPMSLTASMTGAPITASMGPRSYMA